ncbi:zinc transporter ZIP12 [Patella vulgata]|uniref:zinc transporter ZIP12 n=1 Tax=Patella vulgata TaxID=6465 RepID=UPI00218078EA|nr:zinc transporter ZIP12 [Patella vulgata]
MMRMLRTVPLIFVIFTVLHCVSASGHDDHGHGGIDVFDELKKKLNITGNYLPASGLKGIMDTIFHSFSCSTKTPTTCKESICILPSSLIQVVGGSQSLGINEEQFEDVAIVLLYHLKNLNDFCKQTINASISTLETYQDGFVLSIIAPGVGNVTNEYHLDQALELLNKSWEPHTHEDDDHEEEHHDEVHIFDDKCLSADIILHHLSNETDIIEREHFGDVATLMVYHLFIQSPIKHTCRLLPVKTYFIDELFEEFHAVNDTIVEKEFNELLTKLQIAPTEHHEEEEGGHGHDHIHAARKRRSVAPDSLSRSKRASHDGHDHGHESDHSTPKTCYSAKQLLTIFESPAPVSKDAFTQLCPALIYQQISGSCKGVVENQNHMPTAAERYGYGTAANVIITLCSVFGAILFPCTKDRCYAYFMATFMGLAVGTLASDAILHLIPEAFGIHKHDDHDHDHGSDEIVVEPFVWYGFAMIGGIYLFYLLESVFTMLAPGHSHALHKHTFNGSYPQKPVGMELQDKDIHAIAGTSEPEKKLHHLALMIIIGDAIHNFADGLAIAAGFTQGVTEGVSVSLAVFCHELPHELGDFAVLLKTGMKFKNAIFWNVLSSLTAFIGLYVGLSVAEDDIARQWIFAITAGMFLYIALVDILPQLAHPPSIGIFAMTNVGILIGVAIMLLIGIFENQLRVKG